MTDAELTQLLTDIKGKLGVFPAKDQPLTKRQKSEKNLLEAKQDCLLRMKLARERHETSAEYHDAIYYGMLDSWIGKNRYLRYLFRSKMSSGLF